MAEQTPSDEVRLVSVARPSIDIYGGERSLWAELSKAVRPQEGASKVGEVIGVRDHLIDKIASRRLRDLNTTHGRCVLVARNSSYSMGHRDQAIYEALNPLCRNGWQDVLDSVGEDDCGDGEGFIEIVWDARRENVLGINHLDGTRVFVVVESEGDSERYHYQVQTTAGTRDTVAMAAYGDLLGLRERFGEGLVRNDAVDARVNGGFSQAPLTGRIVNSEVVHLREPNSRDPYLGYPIWVSATPAIELVQAMTRHEFDYHFNRGVPELLYEVIGGSLNTKDWDKIEALFRSSQGLSNTRKTAAVHFKGAPDTIQTTLHKLERDGTSDPFGENVLTLAMLIATAHGTPPMLANILLPGKIGSSNEGPNALLLYQKTRLGQVQSRVSRVLADALADVNLAGPAGVKRLTRAQFLGSKYGKGEVDPTTGQQGPPKDENGSPIYHETGNGFKTVLDGMTLGAQQTVARMKEPMAGSGRNPEDGLLDGADDRKPGDPKKSR